MRISIITAVYNRKLSISQTLQSVASQTWPDIEHVIVDGSSTDGTLEILRKHQFANLNLISEPDQGIYDAINKGIQASTGDVVGLLHSDDRFFNSTVLSEVATIFEENDVDAVYADAAFFRPGAPHKIIRRYSSASFSTARIGFGWMPAHTTLFLRRDVFRRCGLYSTDYQIAADFEYVARIFHRYAIRALYIPDVWVLMQTGGASTRGPFNTLILNKEVMRACRENNIQTNYLKILSKYPKKIGEYFIRGR